MRIKVVLLAALGVLLLAGQNGAQPLPTGLSLILNEVELNPQGADAGREWVELYNPTPGSVDLHGWWVAPQWDRGRAFQLSDHVRLVPHQHLVVVLPGLHFSNRDETVVLLDPGKNEVDRTPGPLSDAPGTSGDDRCWARLPDGSDSGSFRDWSYLPCTPGRPNGEAEEE